MLRIYKAEFSKKVKNIEARTKKLYSYIKKWAYRRNGFKVDEEEKGNRFRDECFQPINTSEQG